MNSTASRPVLRTQKLRVGPKSHPPLQHPGLWFHDPVIRHHGIAHDEENVGRHYRYTQYRNRPPDKCPKVPGHRYAKAADCRRIQGEARRAREDIFLIENASTCVPVCNPTVLTMLPFVRLAFPAATNPDWLRWSSHAAGSMPLCRLTSSASGETIKASNFPARSECTVSTAMAAANTVTICTSEGRGPSTSIPCR